MGTRKEPYASKHPAGTEPDPAIEKALRERVEEGGVTCAAAFGIAERLKVAPWQVGQAADLLDIKIAKCQLGLFGYQPQKSVVKPAEKVLEALRSAIEEQLSGGKLPCAAAWEIALRFNIKKMDVSSACETLGVKIKPCQLGSF